MKTVIKFVGRNDIKSQRAQFGQDAEYIKTITFRIRIGEGNISERNPQRPRARRANNILSYFLNICRFIRHSFIGKLFWITFSLYGTDFSMFVLVSVLFNWYNVHYSL